MPRWISRFFDLREGEARPVIQSFLVLFLLIGAHTTLETARDALFLTKLPPSQLNLVYIALAGLSFVVAALSTRLAERFGRRNALIGTLCVAAIVTTLLHGMPQERATIMALYVFSGLVGAVLSPQFWLLAAQMFTSAQGRRLFGPIASGGVVGGVVGATTAAVLLARFPVSSLLLVAAFAFVVTALLLTTLTPPQEEIALVVSGDRATPPPAPPSLSRAEQPFVWRVGLLVALSTAAVLTVDFLFKSTAAATHAPSELGEFFATYYAIMNGVSLVVQLFLASRVVRRLGVASATGVMPSLLTVLGLTSLVTGGALYPVLALRMVDGGLRHSLNRVATELLYLPMPTAVRERAKSFIDSVLTRLTQAVTAGALFALGMGGVLGPRVLASIVLGLSLCWLVTASGLRKPYLDLFRRALSRGALPFSGEVNELDVNAAEALVEAMASPEPTQVVAALDVLTQRGRERLIPALILYHDSLPVLFRALEILGASDRNDWIPLGERLLSHPDESVRVAAVRALAKHGIEAALTRAAEDPSPTVQAYALLHLGLRPGVRDLSTNKALASMAKAVEGDGDARRGVLLAAIADAADPRAASLVLDIAQVPRFTRNEQNVVLLARAMAALRDPRHIPFCISQLATRAGRDAIRQALIAIGEPALTALSEAAANPHTPRRVRVHIPRTIALFGTQRACDILMLRLFEEKDGFVRYKVLRALGHIVAASDVRVDREKVEAAARQNLIEHLRLTALRAPIQEGLEQGAEDAAHEQSVQTERLLLGLLAEKETQSLERAFRLLKIAHKREDIHRVHTAARSTDKRARSNAGEFLDTLLSGRGQEQLRELLRLVVEDLDAATRGRLSEPYLGEVPRDRRQALLALVADRDAGLSLLSGGDSRAAGAT